MRKRRNSRRVRRISEGRRISRRRSNKQRGLKERRHERMDPTYFQEKFREFLERELDAKAIVDQKHSDLVPLR